MAGLTTVFAFLLASASTLHAEQYWVAYEGNDFPENEGWRRTYGDGTFPPSDGPDRWLENGELVVSTARNPSLWEYYSRTLVDPDPGERFVAEWRARTSVISGPLDDGVTIARSGVSGHVSFYCRPDGLLVQTDGVLIPLDMSLGHTYRVESYDMARYSLSVDEQEVYTGFFASDSLLMGYVAFGPDVQGASSIGSWDYFHFGVIPEPATALLVYAGIALIRIMRR